MLFYQHVSCGGKYCFSRNNLDNQPTQLQRDIDCGAKQSLVEISGAIPKHTLENSTRRSCAPPNAANTWLIPNLYDIRFVFLCFSFVASEQLGGNKYLLTDGLFVAKMLDRTLVEYPAKDARYVRTQQVPPCVGKNNIYAMRLIG